MAKKKHLIGGILTTICGRELEEVLYTVDRGVTTCKTCIKLTNDKYPNHKQLTTK